MSDFFLHKYIDRGIRMNEIDIFRLVESRGVAMSELWTKVEIIVENIRQEYQKLYRNNFYINGVHIDDLPEWPMIEINSNENTRVDFADKVYIKIVPTTANGGEFKLDETITSPDGKLTLFYYVYIDSSSILFNRDFFIGIIHHEFSHTADKLGRMKSGDTKLDDMLLKNEGEFNYQRLTENASSNPVNAAYVIYRLLIPTELNALSSQTFGELSAMKSVRQNFTKDLTNTDVWYIYKDIRRFVEEKRRDDSDFWIHDILMNYKNDNKSYLNLKTEKERKYFRKCYKESFLKRCENKLRDLLWNMKRSAETYYMQSEELLKKEEINNLISSHRIYESVHMLLGTNKLVSHIKLDVIYPKTKINTL